ncbi:hypothetical protein NK718_14325 [Alsobacter sp. SYSU M60028]|uniref:MOSC domain-containing protein n=1 Tax=Alsobacter ponti TaxID=2962936 RepID=A0ABT1LF03_9HYPH|nr:hypothetical protein [Alsobacter ponti]MCP8939701.1 hypothetical protein [Alsobacter ponti]
MDEAPAAFVDGGRLPGGGPAVWNGLGLLPRPELLHLVPRHRGGDIEAETLAGTARVLDRDTVEVAGVRIRLNGIDAEEVGHGFSEQEPNGAAARAGMQVIVSGVPVRCALNGERTDDRMVGVGFNKAGEDIIAERPDGLALDCCRFSGGRYRSLEPASARAALIEKPHR